MNKRIPLLLAFLWLSLAGLFCQKQATAGTSLLPGREAMPRLALKSNLLYDLSTTFSLGVELRLNDYLSLDLPVSYNPWTFSGNRKLKHVLIQPELRYWINEPFNGHFTGMHLLYSHYNAGNLPLGPLRNSRYQGNAYGLGFSYGYQWILSSRWSIETTIGLGYAYLDYTEFECSTCGKKLGEDSRHYFGPTKAAVSLVYILK